MKTVNLPTILKSLMKQKGLSARALSKEIGIPVSSINSYLAAKKASYSPEHLRKLADFFSVSIDRLLFGTSDLPKNLDSLKTEQVFSGWLKLRVERMIPDDSGEME